MKQIKPGVELLNEVIGDGLPVERHKHYRVRQRMWLRRGEAVRWTSPDGYLGGWVVDEDGTTTSDIRVDRLFLTAGVFYGIQGMRVGGTRTLRIAPHLAYGEKGVAGVIPANAVLTVEITVLVDRPEMNW